MKRPGHIVYTIFFWLLALHGAQAQETTNQPDTANTKVVIDTIRVGKNSFVFTKDSVFFSEHDTIIYVTDTIHTRIEEVIKQKEGEEQQAFYDRLKEKLEKRKLAEIIAGSEYGEFYNRFYTGIFYARGSYIRAIGYGPALIGVGSGVTIH